MTSNARETNRMRDWSVRERYQGFKSWLESVGRPFEGGNAGYAYDEGWKAHSEYSAQEIHELEFLLDEAKDTISDCTMEIERLTEIVELLNRHLNYQRN